MKTSIVSILFAVVLAGCASSPYGKKVNEPFSGNAYESTNRFFRATGKGESSSENIARGKADIDAKTILGGQVNTTMKQVADNYMGQTENERGADVAEKFQSLARQVMNTELADLRKIGEKKYYKQIDETTAHIWSSATLYNDEQQQLRQQWFKTWFIQNTVPSFKSLFHFHKNTGEGNPEIDLVINRGDKLFTVSITGIVANSSARFMQYIDLINHDSTTIGFATEREYL